MAKAIRLSERGGPEVLRWEEVELGTPAAGEALVRHTAIGVNFADVYLRTGLYPQPLPSGIGSEAAGVVEAVGRKVRGVKPGDRVVYSVPFPGAYAEQRLLPADALLKIPSGISDEQAAAVLLKGLTTWFLLRETYKVKRGDVLLIPAAAGGVGLILSQWARSLGAKLIGVVSTEDKARLARRNGCHQVLVGYADLAARVRKLNRGHGVDLVYDGVGKDTLFASLDSLRPRGMMVSFGNASGAAPPFSPLELAKRGSLYFTRTGAADYLSEAAARRTGARALFALIRRKAIRVHIGQRYPLAQAAQAQRDLESRRTLGSTVLIP
ncbi:MAG TPA: quinone oxidoreductase [Steroidobacteraceae bacterium]|jgi:NADPH2:quinone reductase